MIKKKPYNLPFEKTEFVTRVSKLRGKILEKSTEVINGKIQERENYLETKQEEYVSSVAQKMANIIFTFEQLEFIPVFMRRFPDRKFF